MKLCKPYRSPLQAVFIVVFTAVFVMISAVLARYFPDIAVYLRLAGGVFLLAGVVLLFRYTMTEYVYALSESDFSVRCTTGFAEKEVFSVELDEKSCLYTKAEFSKLKIKRASSGGRSYRQNLTAASAFLVYEVGGKKRWVEIEPNIEFFSILKNRIDEINSK